MRGVQLLSSNFKRRPSVLLLFFLAALVLSWIPELLHRAGTNSVSGLNPIGVLMAALACSALERGAVKPLLRSMIKKDAPFICYVVAVVLPFFLVAVAVVVTCSAFDLRLSEIAHSFAQAYNDPSTISGAARLLLRFAGSFLVIVILDAAAEEAGWRGYALPFLQQWFSPIMATLVLSPIWWLWHAPLFGPLYGEHLPAFTLFLLADSMILTWLYNASGGSVLLPTIAHTTQTMAAAFVFPLFSGPSLNGIWWSYAMVWLIAAAVILFATRLAGSHTTALPQKNEAAVTETGALTDR